LLGKNSTPKQVMYSTKQVMHSTKQVMYSTKHKNHYDPKLLIRTFLDKYVFNKINGKQYIIDDI
jgi:hypothetical protein